MFWWHDACLALTSVQLVKFFVLDLYSLLVEFLMLLLRSSLAAAESGGGCTRHSVAAGVSVAVVAGKILSVTAVLFLSSVLNFCCRLRGC